ncbi:MAG: DUF505 family protein [Candidatus Aminicenantes bacterium]|nr:DUF505 family protein [Candidatus Aminicenantes bacterium]
MIITRKHALLIKRMAEKWQGGMPLEKALDSLTDEELEYLFHLELSGLVIGTTNAYELTQSGHLIAEAISECEASTGKPEEWDENFRFIGSEVISMIEITRFAQSEAFSQEKISAELHKRGLSKDGRLLPVAESILQAYNIAEPGIFITPQLAEKIKKMPPGPGKKSILPLTSEEIFQLEAMRLLTFSVPYGNSYSLTGAGQQIRAGLLKGAAVNFPLTDEILYSLLVEDEEDEEIEKKLRLMGAKKDKDKLLPAGNHLLRAAFLLYLEPITVNPSIDLDSDDLRILKTIHELWKINQKDPTVYPTYQKIRETIEKSTEPINPWKISYTTYLLESCRLIDSTKNEENALVYKLTEWGEKVLKDRKEHGNKEVLSPGVMAITTTRMENLSPDDHWVEIAEEEGLLGNGYPSKSGRLFAQIATNIERLPLISAFEAKVLKTLPLWRGMFEEDIFARFPKKERDHVKAALRKLVAHALVDLLPGGLYKVTEAGEKFKRGVAVVPEGIEFPVTPHLLRLLIAASQSSESGKINWKEAEKLSGLATEVFEKNLVQATQSHFIHSDKITTAGNLLIEGVLLLKEVKTAWNEIEL